MFILNAGQKAEQIHVHLLISIQIFNQVVAISWVCETLCYSPDEHSVHQK